MNKVKILIGCLYLFTSAIYADLSPQTGQQIDTVVNQAMQRNGIPGLVLGITMNGAVVWVKAYGYADLQNQKLANVNQLFGIGSVSKVITSFAVMNLIQEGKINLDDSILKYIPEAPAQWQEVTIRQLLSHSSGIPQHVGPYLPWSSVFNAMANQPMQFAPGTDIKYNNFGFILLSRVVELVSGQPFGSYLQTHLYSPLSMNQTGFPSARIPGNMALGYRYQNGEMQPNQNDRPWLQMWGSGGIVTTINDMLRWDLAMYQGALLSPETYRLMWTPVYLKDGQPAGKNNWSWALGWQVSYRNNKLVAFKDGAIRGYSTFFVRHIDDKISVFVMTNATKTNLRPMANAIFLRVKNAQ